MRSATPLSLAATLLLVVCACDSSSSTSTPPGSGSPSKGSTASTGTAPTVAQTPPAKPMPPKTTTPAPTSMPAPSGATGTAASKTTAAGAPDATATLSPTAGNDVRGTVTFTQQGAGVAVHVSLTGLKPGEHGFHVHEKGDCSSSDGMSAGDHFNPMHMQHAGPTAAEHHMGDLGNVTADAQGKVESSFTTQGLALEGMDSIVGRAVIVHERADDLTSQPGGNAGARLACGVIEAAGAPAAATPKAPAAGH